MGKNGKVWQEDIMEYNGEEETAQREEKRQEGEER